MVPRNLKQSPGTDLKVAVALAVYWLMGKSSKKGASISHM